MAQKGQPYRWVAAVCSPNWPKKDNPTVGWLLYVPPQHQEISRVQQKKWQERNFAVTDHWSQFFFVDPLFVIHHTFTSRLQSYEV